MKKEDLVNSNLYLYSTLQVEDTIQSASENKYSDQKRIKSTLPPILTDTLKYALTLRHIHTLEKKQGIKRHEKAWHYE